MIETIRNVLGGNEAVETELVVDPPRWPETVSDDARLLLGVSP